MTDEQTGDGERLSAGLDAAVQSPAEDRYGFTHVAKQLALAIEGLGRDGSAVIALEGAWGSGKTSLLNLLRFELEAGLPERTFVLSVSPWLDGGSMSPVEHLMWQNGLVGNESEITHKRVLSDEELSAVRSLLAKRLAMMRSKTPSLTPAIFYHTFLPGEISMVGRTTSLRG